MYIEELGKRARLAEATLRSDTAAKIKKNAALKNIAGLLAENSAAIIAANGIDLNNAKKKGLSAAFTERLTVNETRIKQMITGIEQVAALPDPTGGIIGGNELPNGLSIVKKRVPLGVVGIIFESRPNVTSDAAALCLKSGNVCILRGGSDAVNSNMKITEIIRRGISMADLPADAVIFVEDTNRETTEKLMKAEKYIDVLIPRGGKSLIKSVTENASVPVIKTGEGNCHVYVDEFADLEKALKITDNAKTQRVSVCNSIETLLVHRSIATAFLPEIKKVWDENCKHMEIYGDEFTESIIGITRNVTEEDYFTEYNDYKIAVRIVDSVDEAINHINKYGTKHSECIVTENMSNAEKFLRETDAAAVYVNASTRFTDGYEFGFGAEIGISTQKLHARGPMGLTELTTYKYLINGNGQIRT